MYECSNLLFGIKMFIDATINSAFKLKNRYIIHDSF